MRRKKPSDFTPSTLHQLSRRSNKHLPRLLLALVQAAQSWMCPLCPAVIQLREHCCQMADKTQDGLLRAPVPPCSALRKEDGTYAPAHLLYDVRMERAGRNSVCEDSRSAPTGMDLLSLMQSMPAVAAAECFCSRSCSLGS